MYVVVSGNPKNGFNIFGYWDDEQEAILWADLNLRNSESWWVLEMLDKDNT